eukprot:Nk52_evm6s307 gene=Nk52_evmTU6s307
MFTSRVCSRFQSLASVRLTATAPSITFTRAFSSARFTNAAGLRIINNSTSQNSFNIQSSSSFASSSSSSGILSSPFLYSQRIPTHHRAYCNYASELNEKELAEAKELVEHFSDEEAAIRQEYLVKVKEFADKGTVPDYAFMKEMTEMLMKCDDRRGVEAMDELFHEIGHKMEPEFKERMEAYMKDAYYRSYYE